MFVDDVTTWLAEESTRLTAGSNLFAYLLPESTASFVSKTSPVVGIEEDPGLEPVRVAVPVTGGLPAFDRPIMTVLVRSTDGTAGIIDPRPSRGLAHHVHSLLETSPPNSTLAGSTRCYTLLPQTQVALFDRDERGRYVWGFQVEAYVSPSTSS